jgi:hypothetical protein
MTNSKGLIISPQDIEHAVINLEMEIDALPEWHPKTEVHHLKSGMPDLEAAQKIVGGYVEMARGTYQDIPVQVLVNEDYHDLKDPMPNLLATAILKTSISGNAIILMDEAIWD